MSVILFAVKQNAQGQHCYGLMFVLATAPLFFLLPSSLMSLYPCFLHYFLFSYTFSSCHSSFPTSILISTILSILTVQGALLPPIFLLLFQLSIFFFLLPSLLSALVTLLLSNSGHSQRVTSGQSNVYYHSPCPVRSGVDFPPSHQWRLTSIL